MMVHRNTVQLFGALLMVMAFDRPADACSCAGPRAACQATWDAAAVFVGQVVEVGQNIEAHRAQTTAAPELFFYKRRVRLEVIELFRGPAASTVDVYTGLGGGDCGYDFVAGGTYLIYASESSGRYQTHSCMRTRPLEQATEDLAYLRGFARTPSALGLIDGTAMRWDQDLQREPDTASVRGRARRRRRRQRKARNADRRRRHLRVPGAGGPI